VEEGFAHHSCDQCGNERPLATLFRIHPPANVITFCITLFQVVTYYTCTLAFAIAYAMSSSADIRCVNDTQHQSDPISPLQIFSLVPVVLHNLLGWSTLLSSVEASFLARSHACDLGSNLTVGACGKEVPLREWLLSPKTMALVGPSNPPQLIQGKCFPLLALPGLVSV
jgi:hypothetical protein